MFSFDLKSAYHHIEINEAHRKFLGFQWQGTWFEFCVLPFGITSAGYIFTKLCRVVLEKWRSMGIKICMFLDDGLCVTNLQQAESAANMVRSDLLDAGFLLAHEKCIWRPTQNIIWLGIAINTLENKYSI